MTKPKLYRKYSFSNLIENFTYNNDDNSNDDNDKNDNNNIIIMIITY